MASNNFVPQKLHSRCCDNVRKCPASIKIKEAALPLEAIYSPKANNLKNYTPFEGDVFAQKITSILGIFTVQYKKAVITSFYLGTMN